jgi:MFS family permease
MKPIPSLDTSREICRFYALFAASQFLIDSSIWSFFLTGYHQFSLAEAVAFNAGSTAIGGLFDLPTGSWADRFGRRRIVILGFLSRALAATLMIVASSGPVLILAAIASGFGWAQLSGATEAFLHDNLKARGEETNFRRYISNSIMFNYWSRTVALVLSGALFSVHPTLPYITLILALLIGAYFAFSIRELPFERTTAAADVEHIRQGARVFSGSSALLRMSLLMLAGLVLAEQLWFSLQPLLSAAGMQPFEVGMSYALGAFASVVGARIAKWLLVRHRDALAFSLAVAVCGCGGLLFSFLEGPTLVLIAQIVTCAGFGLIASSRGSILHAHIPSTHRAVCLSLFSSTEAVLMGVLGTTLGYLYENYDRSLPPLVVAVACFVLVPALYRAVPQAPNTAGPQLSN